MNREILVGDVLDRIKEIPDESIDCIITSPPYWSLRDYKVEGQLGMEDTYQEYLGKLLQVMTECKRVLKPTGTCWINIGDTYAGSGGEASPNTADSHARKALGKTMAKSLVGIPQRFMINCIDDGWICRNDIPWIKGNHMPSPRKDAFTNSHESIYFFTKTNKTSFWYNTQTRMMLVAKPKEQDLVLGVDYEMVVCLNKSADWITPCASSECNMCKGTGEKSKSFWKSLNYYFDLDSVRVKPKTDSMVKRKTIIQQKLDGKITRIDTVDGTVTSHERDGDKYLANNLKSNNNNFMPVKGVHPIKEKYKDQPNSNVARLHKDRPGNPNRTNLEELFDLPKGPSFMRDVIEPPDISAKDLTAHFDMSAKRTWVLKDLQELSDIPVKDLTTNMICNLVGLDPEQICESCGRSYKRHCSTTRGITSADHYPVLVLCDTKGKNPGDVFYINPRPFPEAHFATYPIELPKRMLTCGCAKQVCNKCGAPRISITKDVETDKVTSQMEYCGADTEGKYNGQDTKNYDGTKAQNPKDTKSRILKSMQKETIATGLTSCECNAGYQPGIVLDPFMGAGTTAVAAEQLGLRWIGIELSEEYEKIIKKRLQPYNMVKMGEFT